MKVLKPKDPSYFKYINGKEIIRGEGMLKFAPAIANTLIYWGTKGFKNVAIYDPFVGSGTIPIVALLNYKQVREIHGNDINPDAVTATTLNLEQLDSLAEDVPCHIIEQNSLTVPIPKSEYPIIVVTDPPFGRKCHWVAEDGKVSNSTLIEKFLTHMSKQKISRMSIAWNEVDIERVVENYFKIDNIINYKKRKIFSVRP